MHFWKMLHQLILAGILISIHTLSYGSSNITDPLIKAGAVTFARLETLVDDLHPQQKVTATIIDGKFKGAKLIGKLVPANRKYGKKALQFNLLSMESKDHRAKKIKAYAIEWDDARVAIVTEADFPYLKRRSMNMAATFLRNNSNHHKIKLGVGSDFGILFISDVG